jgi:hypothetical protein
VLARATRTPAHAGAYSSPAVGAVLLSAVMARGRPLTPRQRPSRTSACATLSSMSVVLARERTVGSLSSAGDGGIAGSRPRRNGRTPCCPEGAVMAAVLVKAASRRFSILPLRPKRTPPTAASACGTRRGRPNFPNLVVPRRRARERSAGPVISPSPMLRIHKRAHSATCKYCIGRTTHCGQSDLVRCNARRGPSSRVAL